MTPLSLWRGAFLPKQNDWDENQLQHIDLILFFTLLSFATGIYSFTKWYKLDHQALILTALILIVSELVAGLALRLFKSPTLALHIGFFGMTLNALNLIYQTGGVAVSAQAFWIPLLIVAFFLAAKPTMAICWSAIVMAGSAWMISQYLSGAALPELLLSPSDIVKETWSGLMVPMVIICIAQAYTAKQREKSILAAQAAQQDSKTAAEKSQQEEQHLTRVLERATDNAEQLTAVSEQLEQQSSELHRQVDDLNINCESQASATEQMNSRLGQMTVDFQQSEQFVKELKNRSEVINDQAQKSAASLIASTDAISNILESNKEIVVVADLITSVAEQTNLLALNAAIEAARAGEQGRGFAVVADQVRELSAKSNQSAVEIRKLLDKSRKEVGQGQVVIQDTAAELSGIIEQVGSTLADVNKLADIMGDQVGVLQELNQASNDVAHCVVQTNQVSDSVATQGAQLSQQVVVLKTLADDLSAVMVRRH
ncbi:MAG: methyl-accepting chemotaxis protein [Moritella sp.]|jgi:methyl-accepting chemotaxis protein